MTVRRRVLAALLVALLPACGAEQQDRLAPVDAVRGSAERVAELGSYRTEAVTRVDGEVVLRIDGVTGVDPARNRTVSSVPDGVAAELGLPVGTSAEQRLVDDVVYVSDPLQGGWTSYPVGDGAVPDATAEQQGFLAALQSAGDVEDLGSEDVRGTSTRRYRGVLTAGVDVEVWLDGEGLLRRMLVEVPGRDGTVTATTLELYDFGVEVDVEAPPADQVREGGA